MLSVQRNDLEFSMFFYVKCKITELEPRPPFKFLIISGQFYKTEAMITSLMEMLELPTSGRMTTSPI